MATAVEMTIALGRTVYSAPNPETDGEENSTNDENGSETVDGETIEGYETRVSVTWRLTESEQNLPLTASLLAEKTVQVLETADRTVRCKGQQPTAREQMLIQKQLPALPVSAPVANGAAFTSSSNRAASPGSGAVGNGTNGNDAASRSHTPAYVPRITKVQSLAIQSLCTRHGVADWELRRLVWERFGKKEPGELNKDQAGELLETLQQDSLHDGLTKDNPVAGRVNSSTYAN